MNKTQEIMEVLSRHGDGDQIRYFNQIIQQVQGEVIEAKPKRVFNHDESQIGLACGVSHEDAQKFTDWLNDQVKKGKELSHSRMIEILYNDDNLTINAITVLMILFKKLDAKIFNALINA